MCSEVPGELLEALGPCSVQLADCKTADWACRDSYSEAEELAGDVGAA